MDSVQLQTIPNENRTSPLITPDRPKPPPLKGKHYEALTTYPDTTKHDIRKSLRASTLDGVFAAIFSNIAGGVLLSDFLLALGAGPVEIGLLASIPMVVNLLQPVGAYWSDRLTSRHSFCLWIYGISRLFWLILVVGIGLTCWGYMKPHQLMVLTLVCVIASHFLGAFGSASWLSWLAALVPPKLRGRYFGTRNSAASFTNLVSIPLAALGISLWPGGTVEGYGIVLLFGVVMGIVSLAFQFIMVDVNPQVQKNLDTQPEEQGEEETHLEAQKTETSLKESIKTIMQNRNFMIFLIFFGLWMFAVNLSEPFFNLYMLDDLGLDVSLVATYNSIHAAAHLVMMILWGKLADRSGNRPILILIGVLVALVPLFWLGTSASLVSIWLFLPFLHLLKGAKWAAIDLCCNNIQLEIAPLQDQATYFAIAAAIAGVSGAIGTTVGGFLAEAANLGGLPGLFVFSTVLRIVALIPLLFVQENRSWSIKQLITNLWPSKLKLSAH